MQEDGERRDVTSEVASFTSTLSELKQKGAALLVVGDLPRAVYHQLCQQMLGTSANTPRRRLLIFTDADPTTVTNTFHPVVSPPSPERTKLITYTTHSRTSVAQHTEARQIPTINVDSSTGLTSLGVEISNAIRTFEQDADDLAPAELRVGFDSLLPLFEADTEQLFRFLHLLTAQIRTVNGMGHFHLPIPYDSQRIRLLEPLFDAVVELHTSQETLYQRWHLRDTELTTEWLPV